MPHPPPPPLRLPDDDDDDDNGEGGGGGLFVYVVFLLFLLLSVSGGVLLFLYIFLPTDEAPSWYLSAGLALIATPWLFWILTCLRQAFSLSRGEGGPANENSRRGHGRARPPAIAEEPDEEDMAAREHEEEEERKGRSGERTYHESESERPLTVSHS